MGETWAELAGWTGGTVAALAAAAGGEAGPIFAATPVGVFASTDASASWRPLGVGRLAPLVQVVAPSPAFAADRTLYAGTRDGLYGSRDGGRTWRRILQGGEITALALAPGAGEGGGAIFAGTAADGILRSDDGGAGWAGANPGLLDLTVLALALSPGFAGDGTGFAATATGLYRTRNGGRAWRAVELPVEEPAVQCLAVSPAFARDRLVLAGAEADGLFRSDDGGTTWTAPPELAGTGVTALAFAAGPEAGRHLAAATEAGVALSADGGATWRRAGAPPEPILSLLFAPGGADAGGREVLLAGLVGGGVARSTDGGATWTPANAGLRARLLDGLFLSPAFAEDGRLFVTGLQSGPFRSSDRGASWTEGGDGLAGAAVHALAAAPDGRDGPTLYAATGAGVHRSGDGGATWRPCPGPTAPVTAVAAGPAVGDRPGPALAAGGDSALWASDDAGDTWRALGRPFGSAVVTALAHSPAYARDRTIFAATSAPAAGGAGHDLALWRSADGGARWDRQFEVASPAAGLALALSPAFPVDGAIFLGHGPSVLRPRRDMYEIVGGARRPAWRAVALPGAGPLAITALAAAPGAEGRIVVFAATNEGVYRSRDGGEGFARWDEGLDPAAVVALAPSPAYTTDRTVYALGLGGTLWRRRDGG